MSLMFHRLSVVKNSHKTVWARARDMHLRGLTLLIIVFVRVKGGSIAPILTLTYSKSIII